MSVLYDYFRAPDPAAVAELMQAGGGRSPVARALADGLTAKGIEPTVTVGQLIADRLGIEWDPDVVESDEIWPTGGDELDQWVVSLDDRCRDTLAAIPDAQLPRVAAEWSEVEEVAMACRPDEVEPILTGLVALARRAAAAGEHLYCFTSL